MIDFYNIAVKYLINKYGKKIVDYTESYREKLRKANTVKERTEIRNNISDKDIVITFNDVPIENTDDINIVLLLNQYYYGKAVKQELEDKLVSMGIV